MSMYHCPACGDQLYTTDHSPCIGCQAWEQVARQRGVSVDQLKEQARPVYDEVRTDGATLIRNEVLAAKAAAIVRRPTRPEPDQSPPLSLHISPGMREIASQPQPGERLHEPVSGAGVIAGLVAIVLICGALWNFAGPDNRSKDSTPSATQAQDPNGEASCEAIKRIAADPGKYDIPGEPADVDC